VKAPSHKLEEKGFSFCSRASCPDPNSPTKDPTASPSIIPPPARQYDQPLGRSFLTEDGEKEGRNRDEEFQPATGGKEALLTSGKKAGAACSIPSGP